MSAKLFQCQFLGYGWTNQSIHYMVICRQKIPNKDLSWSKSEKFTTGYIWISYREHNACVIRRFTHRPPGNGKSDASIVLFHKSQCALRYLDLMSKIQNISSPSAQYSALEDCRLFEKTRQDRSLGTCLTVTANEQNGDWPAPVSRVSVQPVIGWLKYEVARQWSHIVHRPRPHGNVTLPMRS